MPFYNARLVVEWLKFWQKNQAVITGLNVMDTQGMYVITKSMLREDALTAFENSEGKNGPQMEPNYKQTMHDVHVHMFPI
eukprot:12320429-Ditylum_brightwellii.AAC.1